jgi:acetolactate synthase-1/3 small subunit
MSKQLESAGTQTILRLLVRNHPGVMSHVCGLFARRAFNVTGIICLPIADRRFSTILLDVAEEDRLEQVIRQLRKLEDVLTVERAAQFDSLFHALGRRLEHEAQFEEKTASAEFT